MFMKWHKNSLALFTAVLVVSCGVFVVQQIFTKAHTPQEITVQSGPVFAELIPKPDAIRYYRYGICATVSDPTQIDSIFSDVQDGLATVTSMAGLDYVESELDVTMDTGEVLELVYERPVQISWEIEGLGMPIECKFTALRLVLDNGRGIGTRGSVFCGTGTPPLLGTFTISDSLRQQLAALK